MRDIKAIARDIAQDKPVSPEEELAFWQLMRVGMDKRAWKKKMKEIEEALLILKLAGLSSDR